MSTSTTTAPIAHSGLLGSLNRDWAIETGHALPAHPDGTPWPSPAGQHASVAELVDALRTSTPQTTDETLLVLLELTQAGDPLAGRTLLQAMLGRVRRLESTTAGRRLEDPAASSMAAMWSAIRAYPTARRRTRVAANLAMEALAELPDAQEAFYGLGDALGAHMDHEQLCGRMEALCGPSAGGSADDEAVAVLSWAVSSGALSRDEVSLLARVHLGETTPKQLAAELGVSWACLRQRHRTAVRRLAQAVAAHSLLP